MRQYIGLRPRGLEAAAYRLGPYECTPLEPRLDLRRHSATGYDWGHVSSGAAQLALAILADVTDDDIVAKQLYHRYKFDVIATLPRMGWVLYSTDVESWLIKIIAEQRSPHLNGDVIDLGEV